MSGRLTRDLRARLLGTVLAVVLAGCGDLLYSDVAPDPALLTIDYAPSLQEEGVPGGIDDAFAAVDGAHVRVLRGENEETVFDGVVGISRSGGEIRVQAEVELDREVGTYLLLVDLRRGDDPLFEGWAEIELRGGGVSRPEPSLEPVVSGIVFEPASSPRITALGERVQLAAHAAFATGHVIPGRSIGWRSLDPEVVSVSDQGEVTALRAGSGRVEASHQGVAGVLVVEVDPQPASVEVEPAELELGIGQTVPLAAIVRDAGGSRIDAQVQWSSSEEGVATVSGSGEVTGVSEGSAIIEANAGDASGTASVTVRYLPPQVETLAASNVGPRSARLRGSVNPVGLETQVWFQWGRSPSLQGAATTPPVTLEGGQSSVTLSHLLEGLDQVTDYYYRVVATSNAGTSQGEIRSFSTHLEVSSPQALTVELLGEMGDYPEAYWDYDIETYPDASFQLEVRRLSPSGNWEQAAAVGAQTWVELERALTAGVTYRFRVRACREGFCSLWSEPYDITPEGEGPFVETWPSIDMEGSEAVVRARILDGGHETTEYWFEWADNNDFVGASTTPVRTVDRAAFAPGGPAASSGIQDGTIEEHRIEEFLTGLAPETEYHFRPVVQNADGSDTGRSFSFAAGEAPPPVVDLTVTQSFYAWPELDWRYEEEVPPTFFEIERRVGTAGSWEWHVNRTANWYWDEETEPGIEYGYRVRACYEQGGCSPAAGPVFVTVEEVSFSPPLALIRGAEAGAAAPPGRAEGAAPFLRSQAVRRRSRFLPRLRRAGGSTPGMPRSGSRNPACAESTAG